MYFQFILHSHQNNNSNLQNSMTHEHTPPIPTAKKRTIQYKNSTGKGTDLAQVHKTCKT